MVAVIMAVGFRERVTAATVVSIALACGGISLLYKGGNGATLNLAGVVLVFLSALSYAVWIVAVNRSSLNEPSDRETHLLLSGFRLAGLCRSAAGLCDLQPVPSPLMWVNAVALALFPTIVSLVAMAGAIRRIGSTPTAILGALEPVTALFFGVAVFGERFTLRIGTGVLLILVAVTAHHRRQINPHPHLRHAPGPVDGPSAPAALGRALGAPPAAAAYPPYPLTDFAKTRRRRRNLLRRRRVCLRTVTAGSFRRPIPPRRLCA